MVRFCRNSGVREEAPSLRADLVFLAIVPCPQHAMTRTIPSRHYFNFFPMTATDSLQCQHFLLTHTLTISTTVNLNSIHLPYHDLRNIISHSTSKPLLSSPLLHPSQTAHQTSQSTQYRPYIRCEIHRRVQMTHPRPHHTLLPEETEFVISISAPLNELLQLESLKRPALLIWHEETPRPTSGCGQYA